MKTNLEFQVFSDFPTRSEEGPITEEDKRSSAQVMVWSDEKVSEFDATATIIFNSKIRAPVSHTYQRSSDGFVEVGLPALPKLVVLSKMKIVYNVPCTLGLLSGPSRNNSLRHLCTHVCMYVQSSARTHIKFCMVYARTSGCGN